MTYCDYCGDIYTSRGMSNHENACWAKKADERAERRHLMNERNLLQDQIALLRKEKEELSSRPTTINNITINGNVTINVSTTNMIDNIKTAFHDLLDKISVEIPTLVKKYRASSNCESNVSDELIQMITTRGSGADRAAMDLILTRQLPPMDQSVDLNEVMYSIVPLIDEAIAELTEEISSASSAIRSGESRFDEVD